MSRSYLVITPKIKIIVRPQPDLKVVQPEANTIGIEQTRTLIRWAHLKPYQSRQKTALILKAEKLTVAAQNSLLKTLEEPPQNTQIALLTHLQNSLLPTVISRCQTLRWESLDQNPLSQLFSLEKTVSDDFSTDPLVQTLADSDLAAAFLEIEKFLKDRDRTQIENWLDNTITRLHNRLTPSTIIQNFNLIEELEATREKIARGANLKLALENLHLNLQSR